MTALAIVFSPAQEIKVLQTYINWGNTDVVPFCKTFLVSLKDIGSTKIIQDISVI